MMQMGDEYGGGRVGRFCRIGDLVPVGHLEDDGNGLPGDLLETSWAEVVGPELGAITRPLRIKSGVGRKTGYRLYLETPGSCAQRVNMCLGDIIDRVNSVCGYAAVEKVSIVQTTFDDFAKHTPRTSSRRAPPVQVIEKCESLLAPVADSDVRDELMKLCVTVMLAEDDAARNRKRKS
ncbi:MAG: DUF721 domain-containing protein [Rhodobacteraceae bacterium]|nr:DUF721 domain-containing protein [Paracoccaceae bacterium]